MRELTEDHSILYRQAILEEKKMIDLETTSCIKKKKSYSTP